MAEAKPMSAPPGATGVLVLASGDVVWGRGFGAEGQAVGEVCFHTAMTGYQEIMTDPSFAGQIINFTFPHIGNVGANPDDIEADDPHALGMIVREDVTEPSNFRSNAHLDAWMKQHARIGLSGIDTRALTRRIRQGGAPNGVIAHSANGEFDIPLLLKMAQDYGVDKNALFLQAIEQYDVQARVIQNIKKALDEEDGDLTTSKEYVKGRVNIYANPLVKELPKHADAANRTLQTMLTIIKELGKPPTPKDRLTEMQENG